jgi:AraC-like DNA-binding protein
VEELAQLGGYTLSTFRRIFNNVFHEPVYEWMLARRKEGILDDLNNSECSISEICYKYGFESLPHFSNFCKKSFGASPRNLRRQDIS